MCNTEVAVIPTFLCCILGQLCAHTDCILKILLMLLHEAFDEPMVDELRAVVGHWDHTPDQEGTLGGCGDVCVCGVVVCAVRECEGNFIRGSLHKEISSVPQGRMSSHDTMRHGAM